MDRLEASAIRVPGADVRGGARCASTNLTLLDAHPQRRALLAANVQSAGRGRRGRRWRSPAGYGVLFSLGLTLARPVRELSGVSIGPGVAAGRALRGLRAGG